MNETERDAQRNILINWNKLSLGDVSVIELAISNRGFQVVTMPGTAYGYFWMQLVRLGWAMDGDPLKGLEAMPVQPQTFKLTDKGMDLLPKFVAYRDLFRLTIWNNTPRDQRSSEPPRGFSGQDPVSKTDRSPDPIVQGRPHGQLKAFFDVLKRFITQQ